MEASGGSAAVRRLALDRRKQLLGGGFVILVALIWVRRPPQACICTLIYHLHTDTEQC